MRLTVFGVLSFLLTLLFPLSSHAHPDGQLYWVVENYPDNYSLYTSDSNSFNGAKEAIKLACEVYAGGTYVNDVNMHDSAVNEEFRKGGYCLIRVSPFVSGTTNGSYYEADLYCNGDRLIEGVSSLICEPAASLIIPEKNLGPCPLD